MKNEVEFCVTSWTGGVSVWTCAEVMRIVVDGDSVTVYICCMVLVVSFREAMVVYQVSLEVTS